jgi:hypothetical protein
MISASNNYMQTVCFLRNYSEKKSMNKRPSREARASAISSKTFQSLLGLAYRQKPSCFPPAWLLTRIAVEAKFGDNQPLRAV